jgi:hypothetical protein
MNHRVALWDNIAEAPFMVERSRSKFESDERDQEVVVHQEVFLSQLRVALLRAQFL